MAKKKDYSNHPQVKLTKVIGAKVEKAVTETVDSVVESGSSFFQSVVDTASQALESGAEMVEDAKETVYEALPEMEDVEDAVTSTVDKARSVGSAVGSAATTVIDTMDKTSQSVVPIFKAVTSPVGINFLNDLAFGRTSGAENPFTGETPTVGNEIFSDAGVDLIRKIVIDEGILEKGSVTINEDIYDKLESGISVNQSGGSSAGDIINVLAEGDPTNEAKLILGRFSAYIDDNGDIIAEDRFNYNDFKNPIDGETYTSEQYEQALKDGKFTRLEVLWETVSQGMPNYAMARQLGFLLGSKDYIDDSRDQGRRIRINLGKAKDSELAVKESPRPVARPEAD